MINTVSIGGTYVHNDGELMKIIAASSPELDNYVRLVEPSKYMTHGFQKTWFGSWAEFDKEWKWVDFTYDGLPIIPCPKGEDHEWGTDGQHSNVFCKKCFCNPPPLKQQELFAEFGEENANA